MIFVIETPVNRAQVKDVRSATFYSAAEVRVHMCVSDPQSVVAVTIELVRARSFTVPLAKFVKQEVQQNSIKNARMKERFVMLSIAVEAKKTIGKTEFR